MPSRIYPAGGGRSPQSDRAAATFASHISFGRAVGETVARGQLFSRGGQVSAPNGSKLDADLLTAAEIELLMRQCSRRAPTGVRNRALLAVLWRCGLRLGEALALAPKDFDPDSGTL